MKGRNEYIDEGKERDDARNDIELRGMRRENGGRWRKVEEVTTRGKEQEEMVIM